MDNWKRFEVDYTKVQTTYYKGYKVDYFENFYNLFDLSFMDKNEDWCYNTIMDTVEKLEEVYLSQDNEVWGTYEILEGLVEIMGEHK